MARRTTDADLRRAKTPDVVVVVRVPKGASRRRLKNARAIAESVESNLRQGLAWFIGRSKAVVRFEDKTREVRRG